MVVASGSRRRVPRPHYIYDTKLADGAMGLLRLAAGHGAGPAQSRGRVGPIGISEAPPIFRIVRWQGSARNLGRRCGVQAAVVEYLVGGGIIAEVEFGRSPSWGTQVMHQEKPGPGSPIEPIDWLKTIPFEAAGSSVRRGWVGLEAARYRAAPPSEYNLPAITHHWFVLFHRPPEEVDLRYEGVKRHVPPPAGSVMLVPAGAVSQ